MRPQDSGEMPRFSLPTSAIKPESTTNVGSLPTIPTVLLTLPVKESRENPSLWDMARRTERETDRQTGRQKDGRMDKQIECKEQKK